MLAYVKPRIILLDDDASLLEVIHYYFNEKFDDTVEVKIFTKSYDLMNYIQENCYLSESPAEILDSFYTSDKNKESIIKTLKDLSVLSATLVVDHELRGEEITGIELSNELREYFPTSYICMLTSNVPNDQAIKLHNNHNIDLFVDKKNTDAIHNLYTYLSKHINIQKNSYIIDAADIFDNTNILDSQEYINQKIIFLEKNNPFSYLTLNENGDIALIKNNHSISFWRYTPSTKRFIEYE